MKTVILYDILKNNDYAESGRIVFKIALDAIHDDNKVIIDMEKADSVPTSFMNTSFGELIRLYGVDQTKNLFVFNHILKSQIERIHKYFNDYEELIRKMLSHCQSCELL